MSTYEHIVCVTDPFPSTWHLAEKQKVARFPCFPYKYGVNFAWHIHKNFTTTEKAGTVFSYTVHKIATHACCAKERALRTWTMRRLSARLSASSEMTGVNFAVHFRLPTDTGSRLASYWGRRA